jgi:putative membrane protein
MEGAAAAMSALAVILPLALLYSWGVRRTRRRWPPLRTLAAVGGLLALGAALGPLDGPADRELSAHMIQHVLIGVVAPASLALAAPIRLALGALPPRARRRLGAALHTLPARALAAPAVAVPLAAAVLFAGHVPAAMQAIAEHPLLHDAEHAALFWTALLAWVVVLGVDPLPRAPGAIGLLAVLSLWMVAMAAIGSQYASEDHVLIAAYAQQPGALADQHAAGIIMWLGGMVTVAPVAVIGSMRAMWLEEQRQRTRERLEALR